MKQFLPYLIVLIVFAGLVFLSTRNRRRQVATQEALKKSIGPGTEVMTTSGLYGTVVEQTEDSTVVLSIAPGVEVKWALAALRDIASLPTRSGARSDEAHDDAGDQGVALDATNPDEPEHDEKPRGGEPPS